MYVIHHWTLVKIKGGPLKLVEVCPLIRLWIHFYFRIWINSRSNRKPLAISTLKFYFLQLNSLLSSRMKIYILFCTNTTALEDTIMWPYIFFNLFKIIDAFEIFTRVMIVAFVLSLEFVRCLWSYHSSWPTRQIGYITWIMHVWHKKIINFFLFWKWIAVIIWTRTWRDRGLSKRRSGFTFGRVGFHIVCSVISNVGVIAPYDILLCT